MPGKGGCVVVLRLVIGSSRGHLNGLVVNGDVDVTDVYVHSRNKLDAGNFGDGIDHLRAFPGVKDEGGKAVSVVSVKSSKEEEKIKQGKKEKKKKKTKRIKRE